MSNAALKVQILKNFGAHFSNINRFKINERVDPTSCENVVFYVKMEMGFTPGNEVVYNERYNEQYRQANELMIERFGENFALISPEGEQGEQGEEWDNPSDEFYPLECVYKVKIISIFSDEIKIESIAPEQPLEIENYVNDTKFGDEWSWGTKEEKEEINKIIDQLLACGTFITEEEANKWLVERFTFNPFECSNHFYI